jgi:hypothetical protein
MFIASAPMLLDFFHYHPEHYASRTSEISALNPAVNKGHLPSIIARTFGLALAKYNFWGDQNWRQNYPPYPILNPLTGIAFLIGLIYIFIKFFQLAYARFKEGVRSHKLDVYVFLLAWFFVLLIPEFLANEGNPHALRAIGTLPVAAIIATIPLMWLINRYDSFGHSFRIFIASMLVFTFVFIGLADPIKYFVFFANNPRQHQSFEASLKKASDYLRTLPAAEEKYIVTGSMQRLTIKYLNPTLANTFYKYPGEADSIVPSNPANFTIIFTDSDWTTINAQRNRFPGISFEEHRNQFGDTFYVLKY